LGVWGVGEKAGEGERERKEGRGKRKVRERKEGRGKRQVRGPHTHETGEKTTHVR
jgi:hypothetical protein